jgi:hypothetical protein
VLDGSGAAGLQSVVWDFRRPGATSPTTGAVAVPGPRAQASLALPGEYTIVLEIGDKKWRMRATVRPAPARD